MNRETLWGTYLSLCESNAKAHIKNFSWKIKFNENLARK